jgi:hypothetical protein
MKEISLCILVSTFMTFALIPPARSQFPILTPQQTDGMINGATNRQLMQRQYEREYGYKPEYGDPVCFTLQASDWKNYLKRYAPNPYPYKEIALLRKWESRKGCSHLFEEDGTINKIKGINDQGSTSGSQSPRQKDTQALQNSSSSTSQVLPDKVELLYHQLTSMREPLRSRGMSLLCSSDRAGVSFRNRFGVSHSDFSLLKRKLGC